MNKNINIGILAIVSVLSLGFGYIQSIAADKARIEAERNLALSMEVQKEASKAQQMAHETQRRPIFNDNCVKN